MTLREFINRQSEFLSQIGRVRTAETYSSALRSLMHFCGNPSLTFSQLDADFMCQYEAWLRARHLSRNTSSFYMRVLRRIYNLAVREGLVKNHHPFCNVYTGIDKTSKRAIDIHELRSLSNLSLPDGSPTSFARDMFLLSFYLRGMSFVDMAYLRKSDLRHGFIIYTRRKTGQRLSIRWEPVMQRIISSYDTETTQYLLPIIQKEDGTERRQYLNRLLYVNRKLKTIGSMANISIPLTMYVARHSWASIAHNLNVPLPVISEGMGHTSEETTRIYLTSIQSSRVDEANRGIIEVI